MKFDCLRLKRCLKKGYLLNWTEKIFTVNRVLNTIPIQYKVRDYRNEEIIGSFYGVELQRVVKPEQYAIERVIRRRRVRDRMHYFVKWLGYNDEHNSWVDDIGDLA